MRADAARNLESVLITGSRLLAEDPSTSIAEIARQAGVNRSTVYRHFPTREELMAAVHQAKLDEAEEAMVAARLDEAPVNVVVHKIVEMLIVTSRRWPVDASMAKDEAALRRTAVLMERFDRFIGRAIEEGAIRSDLPANWARDLLISMGNLAAHDQQQLEPGPAADLVTEAYFRAVGPPG